MVHEEKIECDYRRSGMTVLFRTESGQSSAEHEARTSNSFGIEAGMLSPDELRTMDAAVEFDVRGGLHFPGDARLVPAQLVRGLAAVLERRGVKIHRNCRVERFERIQDRIAHVKTTGGTFAADDVVLASGAWSPLLARDLGIAMPLQAGKGYSITVAHPPVNPRIPYILAERRIAITPFDGALRFAGTLELAGISTTINERRVEAILDAVPLYFRNIPRPHSAQGEVWGGMRPVTPDGLPYVGRFKQVSNLVAATGHAMIGVSLANVTGKIVSEMLSGESSTRALALLHPNRFG